MLFGALGTPLKIGLDIHQSDETVVSTLILNALPSLIIPFILAFLLSKTEQSKVNWKKDWKILLGAGVCFYTPFVLTGICSVEFPTVVAGIVGLLLFLIFCMPASEKIANRIWLITFAPYLFFILLLVCWKLVAHDKLFTFAKGIKNVSLYQPSIVFVIASIAVLYYFNQKQFGKTFLSLIEASLLKIRLPGITILLLICFTQLIAKSLSANIGLLTAVIGQPRHSMIQPLIGISGSFITGSATMSNLLFAGSLSAVALAQQPLLIALLHTGSAIGNAISLQNIVMVKSVISEDISENTILKYTILVVLPYLILVFLSLFILVNLPFNIW